MLSRRISLFLFFALLATMLGAPAAVADSSIGNFQIDGNRADDGPGDDWDTPAVVAQTQTFEDTVGQGDDIFGGGSSKNFDPGSWGCEIGKVPSKNDLVESEVFFRIIAGKQYLAINYVRASPNGDANIDIELNQSKDPNPSCPQLPLRTDGDVVLAFDTERGGKEIFVRAFTWRYTGDGIGVFDELPLARGVWNAAVNIPNTIPGLRAGQFGEAILNLSDSPIGDVECGQFGALHVKTRSSTSVNSELKDRTKAQPFSGPCPDSALDKQVRNVTQGGSFSTSASADPGDEIEYQLTYTNGGQADATNVVITDEVRKRTTFVSCTGGCTTTGSDPGSTIKWELGTIQSGATSVVTFKVQLDATFPAGTTTIKNTATVDSDEEEPRKSNETTAEVKAAPAFTVEKSAEDSTVNVGDTTIYRIVVRNIGNADGSTAVVDDYDEAHVSVDEISDSGMDNGDTITWTGIAVPAGGERTLTYEATFNGPFSGGEGTGGCGEGQFPVVNTVTVTGDSDSETVCVSGEPRFTVDKTADDTSVAVGDEVTYTIKVTNVGDAPGSTGVVDDYDADHLTVTDITPAPDSHDTSAGVISWTTGILQAGQSATFTYVGTIGGIFGGGSGDCPAKRFPVLNTVTVDEDSDSETVCVTADPAFEVDKAASETTAAVGDTVTYTVTVVNKGDGPGSTSVVDDYDEAHVTISNISGDGVDDGDTITWDSGELQPGDSVIFTYDATFHGPFGGGSGSCDAGQFPVVNTVTVNGGDATETVCVAAAPDPSLAKSADADDANVGDLLTYTLVYSNGGDAEATDVRIREDIPAGTTYASCIGPDGTDGACTTTGDPVNRVRWDVGTVAPGDSVSVTLTVAVADDVGCVICNVATASSPDHDTEPSNEVCIDATPAPDPSGANAAGSAYGADVHVSLLGTQIIDQTLVPTESEQSGVGSDSDDDELLGASIPPPGGAVLRAALLSTSSTSTVSEQPAQARQVSIAETAGVDILDGLVTASLVRGVAETTASGDAASFSSVGSTFEDLRVNGVSMNDVAPNTKIGLPSALYGAGSYVLLHERTGSTTRPPTGDLSGGTYAADLAVNMIRVHITALAPLGDKIDVVVSNAVAHADFPQTRLCQAQPKQAVSGHAFIASADTEPSVAPVVVGYTSIPTSGGFDHQHLAEVSIGGGDVFEAGAAVSESTGSLSALESDASSYAEASNVCLLADGDGCTVGAELVRSRSNSAAGPVSRSSNDGDTVLVGLQVLGQGIGGTPDPNTVIELPGIGFLVLNEQVCDNGADLAAGCDDGAGHTGLTVRALRLVVTQPLGLPLGAEVIVAEAHSDALYR